MLAACDLQMELAQHGLVVRHVFTLDSAHFLAQALRPSISGIYVYPSSAPTHVAHRLLGARTQSRAEVAPGDCLLRGASARQQWTLAIPPLLASGQQPLERRTRRIALLSEALSDEEQEEICFGVHASGRGGK